MTHYEAHVDDLSKAQRQEASLSFIVSAHHSKTDLSALPQWQKQHDGLINTHAVLELYELAKNHAVKMAEKTIPLTAAGESAEAISKARKVFINSIEENTIQVLANQILQGNGYEIKLAELWGDTPTDINHSRHKGVVMAYALEVTHGKDNQPYAVFSYSAPEIHQQADQHPNTSQEPGM